MGVEVYRVVVRGQFDALTEDQRAALLAEVSEHDLLRSSFTEWGTFTYDQRLIAFNFRYEVRVDPTDADQPDPVEVGLAKTADTLAEWGLAAKHLRGTSTAMSEMWSGPN